MASRKNAWDRRDEKTGGSSAVGEERQAQRPRALARNETATVHEGPATCLLPSSGGQAYSRPARACDSGLTRVAPQPPPHRKPADVAQTSGGAAMSTRLRSFVMAVALAVI